VSNEEKSKELLRAAQTFAQNRLQPIAHELDKSARFPTDSRAEMMAAGFFGMHYPESYGGGGYDALSAHLVMKELAKASAGVTLTLIVHFMAIDVLLKFGSQEQKQRYLPDLISGRKIAAYTISEMQAGSDAAAINAVAQKHQNGWLLNGKKYFATNGGLADLYFVAFKTEPEQGAKGISMFVIEKGAAGFHIGGNEEKMGCRSSVLTSLSFSDCLAPQDSLIGNVNDGFKIAMYGLAGGRLGMAAMGAGIAEAALQEAIIYANNRIVFNKPLNSLFSAQRMLADMYVKIEAANLLLEKTARKRDAGQDYSLDSSIVKLFVAEAAIDICRQTVQIYGGHGYMRAHNAERYLRDASLMSIGVGCSEVLQMVVGTAVCKLKNRANQGG
jgi:alkylation response protein AidB-like acyl-CoA dehydrogenase